MQGKKGQFNRERVNQVFWFLQWLFLLGALVLAARPCLGFAKRAMLQWEARRTWAARERSTVPSSGAPIAWLVGSSGSLDTLVLFDATPHNLSSFPCLSARGALPGRNGTLIIQGHRDHHFRHIGRLQLGDRVRLETFQDELLTYRVVEREILTIDQLEQRFQGENGFQGLVLITCYPFRYVGPAPERFLVWLAPEGEEGRLIR